MEVEVCNVYYDSKLAGLLIRLRGEGYLFAYDEEYMASSEAQPVSLSLPLRKEPYKANKLFPFFEGLLSEGWLRKVQSRSQKIDENDDFKLLAQNGNDLIGAVSIQYAGKIKDDL